MCTLTTAEGRRAPCSIFSVIERAENMTVTMMVTERRVLFRSHPSSANHPVRKVTCKNRERARERESD